MVSLLLLLLLLPRHSRMAFSYEVGHPWHHAPLIAQHDFPVSKPQETLTAERDSALKAFKPFFALDENIGEEQISKFKNNVHSNKFPDATPAIAAFVSNMLERVYAAGVIAPELMADMMEESVEGVRIVEGSEATTVQLAQIFSTRSAYDLIMEGDSMRFQRDALNRLNINEYLTPNLLPDEARTKQAREDVLAAISMNKGFVQQGERIIDHGEIVSEDKKLVLDSYVQLTEKQNVHDGNFWLRLLGQAMLILIVLLLFPLYLYISRRDYLKSPHTVALFFSLIVIFPLLTYIMVNGNLFSVYMLPLAMVPLFVRIFFDSRTASMAMLTSLLLCTLALRDPYNFLIVEFMMGLAATYSLRELTERSQIFRIAAIVACIGLLTQLAYDMSQLAATTQNADAASATALLYSTLDRSRYVYILISGVSLLFAYPLMYLVERLFGFTSSVTLVELSNINNTLMRKLSKVAQGTFNHSMQVGNMAAEVADKIGAQPQLVRTAALYHDIGKMLNPAFFTENQTGVNPHDELKPRDGISPEEQSAQIIINHVRDGLKLAEKYHLPRVLRDFITTHHGRGKVKYFYIQWQNNHPGETPNEEKFTYPGPNPQTKEQAILMMCDAVEASSRSLKEYTEESIAGLVNRIIDTQTSEGYFRDCDITFRDIEEAKRVLTESLKTIYHTRIAYPELQRPAEPQRPKNHLTYLFGGKRSGESNR